MLTSLNRRAEKNILLQRAKKRFKQTLWLVAKPPVVMSISCALVIIHALDVIIDRINSPLADWIDDLCVVLYPELDKYGAQVLGASFHVALAYLYVVGIRFLIPNLDSFLLFSGHYISPVFIAAANIITPALYSSLIIVLPLIAALGLLNKVICYKKIEKRSNNDTSTTEADAKMRHHPLEYGLGLVFRILNKIKTMPEFFTEAYSTASAINEWIYEHIRRLTSYIASQIKCCRRGEADAELVTQDDNAPDADHQRQPNIATTIPAIQPQTTRMWQNAARNGGANPFLVGLENRMAEAKRLGELANSKAGNATSDVAKLPLPASVTPIRQLLA